MAIAKQCGRCKEFYKPYLKGSETDRYCGLTKIRTDDYNRKITYQTKPIDLCEDCMDEFLKWLDRG